MDVEKEENIKLTNDTSTNSTMMSAIMTTLIRRTGIRKCRQQEKNPMRVVYMIQQNQVLSLVLQIQVVLVPVLYYLFSTIIGSNFFPF